MLGLKAPTNPEWVTVAIGHLDEILLDHAHCEKKAAAFAMILIQRYPEKTRLVEEMIAIAKEELDHLALVMKIIQERNSVLTHDRGNTYAKKLHQCMRRDEPMRLLDSLIVGGLIEARSCERFSLLTKHCKDSSLATFYHSLLASEAGHYRIYTDLAREYFPLNVVKERIVELSECEAEIVRALPNRPTMHG